MPAPMNDKNSDVEDSLQSFKIILLYDDDREHLSKAYYDKHDGMPISLLCRDVVDSNRIIYSWEKPSLTLEELQERHRWEQAFGFPHLLWENCYLGAISKIKKRK
jgi:hypothetical protein